VSRQMAMPTNGYRAPTDAQLGLEGQSYVGQSGPRPAPVAPAPVLGGAAAAPGFKL
jgi:pilus assembly protein CpaC